MKSTASLVASILCLVACSDRQHCACLPAAQLCTLFGATQSVATADLCPSNEQVCGGQTIVTAVDGSWMLAYGSDGALLHAEGDITSETSDCSIASGYQQPVCTMPATQFPPCGSNG